MRRVFIVSSIFLLLAAAICAQSGRKGASPKPPAPVPEASPQADSAKSSKSSLPKFVDGERIYPSKEVDERVKILRKPSAGFTREARQHSTRGYVYLRAILAADETVKHIEVMTGLPDGLTQKAIEAARQIKFKPAMKDGKPVSVWIELQYHFQLF